MAEQSLLCELIVVLKKEGTFFPWYLNFISASVIDHGNGQVDFCLSSVVPMLSISQDVFSEWVKFLFDVALTVNRLAVFLLIEVALVKLCALVDKDVCLCLPKDQTRYNQTYFSVRLALFDSFPFGNIPVEVHPYQGLYIHFIITMIYVCKVQVSY